MTSDIEKFYNSGKANTANKEDLWQHMCGLFNWHISRNNVTLCCPHKNLNKICWPNMVDVRRPEA